MCPDCEGYNCAEGYECQMVDADDEDDSDKKVPTCVLKQTGCDIDKFDTLTLHLNFCISVSFENVSILI